MNYKEEYHNIANSAFPVADLSAGMTLLDYLAATTAQGLATAFYESNVTAKGAEVLAKESYMVAAAMMEERKKYLNVLQD